MGEFYMVCMYILFSYVAVASVHIVYSMYILYHTFYTHTHILNCGGSARDTCVYMFSIF